MIDREILAKRLNEAFDILLRRGVVKTKTELAKILDKDPRNLLAAFSNTGRAMTLNLLKQVADKFPQDLNREWLINGVGDPTPPDASLRPMVEAKAAAGFMDRVSSGEVGTLTDIRSLVPPYDFMIIAEGDSMEPQIQSGDILLCRRIDDRFNPPIGDICVFDTKDGYAVKILEGVGRESLSLHSINPEYPDYTIDIDELQGIARVVSYIRPNL